MFGKDVLIIQANTLVMMNKVSTLRDIVVNENGNLDPKNHSFKVH